jgi:pimeloyl-ACP methyl ester carboxylesterase
LSDVVRLRACGALQAGRPRSHRISNQYEKKGTLMKNKLRGDLEIIRVAQVQPAQLQLRSRSSALGHWLLLLVLSLAFALVSSASVMAHQPAKSNGPAVDGESRYTSLDGARIHYRSYGKGEEALVLIHGWSSNFDFWRENITGLAKRSRVIAIDLPGHGESDKPQRTYSMDMFARAVDAVMRDAKVKRAVLAGHSMGTPVAREFYRKYPQKTLAIVIVDGTLRPFGDKQLMDSFLAGLRGPGFREAGTQMFAGMAGPNLSPEIKERIQASFMNTPQHVVVGAMEGMADNSIWGSDKINVPVLAVMARSPFWPPDTEQFFRGLAPNLDFQMWDGVGHFLHMEKPQQFNEVVIAFLNKNQLLNKK